MERTALTIAALAVTAAALAAQPQPMTFFKDRVGLTSADIQKIEQGQIVTKVLESGDKKYGLLVFGAVYVNAPVASVAHVVRDVKGLLSNKVYLAVQEFSPNGAPPKLSDFDRLQLDKQDVDELEHCKPGDCDIQIIRVAELQKEVNWNAKDKYEQVNRVERERAYQAMTAYLRGGLKSMGSYEDRAKPFNLYEEMRSMADGSYYGEKNKYPGIYHHIVDYPQRKLAGAQDFFYWEKIDFGQEPTIRVNHVTIFPEGAGAAKLVVANKQLYASRYMRQALQIFACVPDTQNPNKPGFFLIEMNDSELPDFGGIKLSIVRRVATGKAVDATRDTLTMYKKRLSGS